MMRAPQVDTHRGKKEKKMKEQGSNKTTREREKKNRK